MITGKKSAEMSYSKYDDNIRLLHKVQIHDSWPEGVKFDSPHTITRKTPLLLLYRGLVSGEVGWKKMQKSDIDNLKKTLADAAPKPRQKRRDAGIKRGPISKQLPPGAVQGEDLDNHSDNGGM